MNFSLPHRRHVMEQLGNLLREVRDTVSLAEKVKTEFQKFPGPETLLYFYLGNEDPGECSPQVEFSRPLKSKIKDSLNQAKFFVTFLSKMEQKRNPRIKELLRF